MKYRYILFVIVALSALLCSCGQNSSESAPSPTIDASEPSIEEETEPEVTFDTEAFKEKVRNAVIMIDTDSVALYNAINRDITYLEISKNVGGSGPDPEKLASDSFEWLAKNGGGDKETLDKDYETLKDSYSEILFTDTDDKEIQKIIENYDTLYLSYSGIYQLACSPSTDASPLSSQYNSYYNDMKNPQSALHAILDIED